MGESLATHSEQVKGDARTLRILATRTDRHTVTRLSDTLRTAEPLHADTHTLSFSAPSAADSAPLVTLVTLGSAALGALHSALRCRHYADQHCYASLNAWSLCDEMASQGDCAPLFHTARQLIHTFTII